jgi:hypothetical protein
MIPHTWNPFLRALASFFAGLFQRLSAFFFFPAKST